MKKKRILMNKNDQFAERIEFTDRRIKQREQDQFGIAPGENKLPVILKPNEVMELLKIKSVRTLEKYEKLGIIKPRKLHPESRFKYYFQDEILKAFNEMK